MNLNKKNLYIHSLGENKGLYIKMWRMLPLKQEACKHKLNLWTSRGKQKVINIFLKKSFRKLNLVAWFTLSQSWLENRWDIESVFLLHKWKSKFLKVETLSEVGCSKYTEKHEQQANKWGKRKFFFLNTYMFDWQ